MSDRTVLKCLCARGNLDWMRVHGRKNASLAGITSRKRTMNRILKTGVI